jgi:hypothetical protein
MLVAVENWGELRVASGLFFSVFSSTSVSALSVVLSSFLCFVSVSPLLLLLLLFPSFFFFLFPFFLLLCSPLFFLFISVVFVPFLFPFLFRKNCLLSLSVSFLFTPFSLEKSFCLSLSRPPSFFLTDLPPKLTCDGCCMLLLLGAETPISVSSFPLVGLLLLSFFFPASASHSGFPFLHLSSSIYKGRGSGIDPALSHRCAWGAQFSCSITVPGEVDNRGVTCRA